MPYNRKAFPLQCILAAHLNMVAHQYSMRVPPLREQHFTVSSLFGIDLMISTTAFPTRNPLSKKVARPPAHHEGALWYAYPLRAAKPASCAQARFFERTLHDGTDPIKTKKRKLQSSRGVVDSQVQRVLGGHTNAY
jgi:hypothetical protein